MTVELRADEIIRLPQLEPNATAWGGVQGTFFSSSGGVAGELRAFVNNWRPACLCALRPRHKPIIVALESRPVKTAVIQ